MGNSNQIYYRYYTLDSHFAEFIEATLGNLGISLNVEPIQVAFDDRVMDGIEGEFIVAKPYKELLKVRQPFYDDFKPLFEQLTLYDQYWGLRYATLRPLKSPHQNPESAHDYLLTMTVNELNMNTNDRIEMIWQTKNLKEEEKKELVTLAVDTLSTIELHKLLKGTVSKSSIFEELIKPSMKKDVSKYFKQVDSLIILCQKEPADIEAVKILSTELRMLYFQLLHCFVMLGLEVE